MLGAERERVRDLRQQVAQVSREATVAHKEIISLEAKLVDGRKEVRCSAQCVRECCAVISRTTAGWAPIGV